jgi:carbamoyl-phosphate synthase large subunit
VNVLLSSAGRRVELLRCLETDLAELDEGSVIACDASLDAPCMHLARRACHVPRLADPAYSEELLEVIERHHVGLIVPTIDTELPILSGLRAQIEALGTRILLSGPRTLEIAGDKLKTGAFLAATGIPHPAQWSAEEAADIATQLAFPVYVKPRDGSGSIGIALATTAEHLRAVLRPGDLVQAVAGGIEYTVDAWVDERGTVTSMVARRRLSVRGGEIEKGVTEHHVPVLDTARRVVERLPDAFGPLTVQVFASSDEVQVIEINARYGGGFPLSWRAGARTTRWAVQYALGLPPDPAELAWESGIMMMRYDQSVFAGPP